MSNVDNKEIDKFSKMAKDWWDKDGVLKTLHQVNPYRLQFIKKFTSIENKNIIDIGCGGGILTESLVADKNNVSGLDASTEAIEIARKHAIDNNLNINYINSTIEDLADTTKDKFDIVTCMEMLEHVPDPDSIIESISKLTKSGGMFFASTLNRNIKSYLLSIVAAEHLLNIVPKGTHEYSKFIKPYELVKSAEKHGFRAVEITGMHYNPITGSFKLGKNSDVNYIIAFQKV
jgi:2-polyprenyl-6-hydroxyphenyl methylase/3-demethylubiquinone-9 3-methyltransferase